MKHTVSMLGMLIAAMTLLTAPARTTVAQTDLSAKIAAAKTAADHEAIAAQFEQEAKDLEAKAALHREMAKHYAMDQYAHQTKPRLKEHCEKLSASLEKAAKEAAEMARVHRELAQKADK